jgi:hypothetical protein
MGKVASGAYRWLSHSMIALRNVFNLQGTANFEIYVHAIVVQTTSLTLKHPSFKSETVSGASISSSLRVVTKNDSGGCQASRSGNLATSRNA